MKDVPYCGGLGSLLAPGISISLVRQDGTMTPRARALVDSGCDVTSFPSDWAEELGIDLGECPAFAGVTAAGKDDAKSARPRRWPPGVEALVLGQKIHLEAVFRPGLPIVLLGREDFFSYFRVSFDQRAKIMRLESYATSN
jgi:hypothetical protein